MRIDPRSLRYRSLVVVVAVIVLPLFWVWAAGTLEAGTNAALERSLRRALEEGSAALEAGDALLGVAKRHQVRLRLIDADGRILEDHDHGERAPLLGPMADLFYGPRGARSP